MEGQQQHRYEFNQRTLNRIFGGVEREYLGEWRVVRPSRTIIPVACVITVDEERNRVRWRYEYTEDFSEDVIVRASQHYSGGIGKSTGRLLWVELDFGDAADKPIRGAAKLLAEYRAFLDFLMGETEVLGEQLSCEFVRTETAPDVGQPAWLLAVAT